MQAFPDRTNAPRWPDLLPGVRPKGHPPTSAPMLSARADPAVEVRPPEATAEATAENLALDIARAVARCAVPEREGVGDADGNPAGVSPEGLDALPDIRPAFAAFPAAFVAEGPLAEREKNPFPPWPSGLAAGAKALARPEGCRARTARQA